MLIVVIPDVNGKRKDSPRCHYLRRDRLRLSVAAIARDHYQIAVSYVEA